MSYILLVDDEPEGITNAARNLAERGYRVVAVTDGREAIARIQEGRPDILVTDILLPLADGLMVIQELQQRYPHDQPGVIVLTYIAADGQPLRDWERLPSDSYVLRHSNAQAFGWQIVLAVEQLLHRSGQLRR